jgi:hypothetical protein
MKAQTGSKGTLYSFFNLNSRWDKWSTPCPSCFTPKKDLVRTVQEAGWTPGPVLTGAENLAPTGIQSLDHPVHTELLYWLHYLSPPLLNFSQLKYLRPKTWTLTQNFYSCLISKFFLLPFTFCSDNLSVGFLNSVCFIHFDIYISESHIALICGNGLLCYALGQLLFFENDGEVY